MTSSLLEWLQVIREIGSLAVLFYVLCKMVPALNRVTNAIYWISGKLGIEPDDLESPPRHPLVKRERTL